MACKRFVNARLCLPGGASRDGSLLVRDGRIVSVSQGPAPSTAAADEVLVDCGGAYLSPGFIDVQCNGGFSIDFSSPHLTSADVAKFAALATRFGVTATNPTLISSPKATVYERNLPLVRPPLRGV